MASYERSNEHQTAIIEMAAASGLALLVKMKEIHLLQLRTVPANSLMMHLITMLIKLF